MSAVESRGNCSKVMQYIGSVCGDSNVVILRDADIAKELDIPLEGVKGIIDTLAHVNRLYLITNFEEVGMYMLHPTEWNDYTQHDSTVVLGIYHALMTNPINPK